MVKKTFFYGATFGAGAVFGAWAACVLVADAIKTGALDRVINEFRAQQR